MSIEDKNKVDGIGMTKDKNGLVLMISDHLDWEDEAKHLFTLQDKINTYVQFIESKQYIKMYENTDFQCFIIKVYLKYGLTDNCIKFFKTVSKQLESLNIIIEVG